MTRVNWFLFTNNKFGWSVIFFIFLQFLLYLLKLLLIERNRYSVGTRWGCYIYKCISVCLLESLNQLISFEWLISWLSIVSCNNRCSKWVLKSVSVWIHLSHKILIVIVSKSSCFWNRRVNLRLWIFVIMSLILCHF